MYKRQGQIECLLPVQINENLKIIVREESVLKKELQGLTEVLNVYENKQFQEAQRIRDEYLNSQDGFGFLVTYIEATMSNLENYGRAGLGLQAYTWETSKNEEILKMKRIQTALERC